MPTSTAMKGLIASALNSRWCSNTP
ncbi:hypothetical protein [Polaromonas sp. JS666]